MSFISRTVKTSMGATSVTKSSLGSTAVRYRTLETETGSCTFTLFSFGGSISFVGNLVVVVIVHESLVDETQFTKDP